MRAIEFEWTPAELQALNDSLAIDTTPATDRTTGADAPKGKQMADQIVDLSKGGVLTLCLGKGYECPSEFAFHPQVHIVHTYEIEDPKTEGWIPSTTRVVVYTDHIPDKVYQYLMATVRQRRLLYIPRKSNGAIAQELHKFLKIGPKGETNGNGSGNGHKPDPVAEGGGAILQTSGSGKQAPRGAIAGLVAKHADLKKGSAEEGRRIFRIAQTEGIKTTLASVTQAVTQAKRKVGAGDIPLSVMPEAAGIQVFKGIQEAIEALQRIQAYAETLEKDKADVLAENAEMRARIELIESAWRGLK